MLIMFIGSKCSTCHFVSNLKTLSLVIRWSYMVVILNLCCVVQIRILERNFGNWVYDAASSVRCGSYCSAPQAPTPNAYLWSIRSEPPPLRCTSGKLQSHRNQVHVCDSNPDSFHWTEHRRDVRTPHSWSVISFSKVDNMFLRYLDPKHWYFTWCK